MCIDILIADNHPIYREGLYSTLQSMNLINQIDQASNGLAVLGLLKNKVYDILITEIEMPLMNGIETSRIINKEYPKTKIIALTMNSDITSVTQMVTFGAFGYLLKTSEAEEVKNAISEVNNGNKYFSKDVTSVIFETLNAQKKIREKKHIGGNNRIRDVLFLMCHELSNTEMAELMCLSPRTIEYYRRKLAELTQSRNYIGVMKFGIKSGILQDEALCQKWLHKLNKISELF